MFAAAKTLCEEGSRRHLGHIKNHEQDELVSQLVINLGSLSDASVWI